MDQKEAAVRLAALKNAKDLLGDEDKALRKAVIDGKVFDPKDRKSAVLSDGSDIGTVSYTKGDPSFAVVDAGAFLAWVKERFPEDVVTREEVAPHAAARILRSIEKSGEMPVGVEYKEGSLQLRVAATAAQKQAFAAALRAGLISIETGARQIEGGHD